MRVGGQRHAPAALPPGMLWHPLYRRLGGPQGLSGQVRKISQPPGFDPRTVQPVARSYTDCKDQVGYKRTYLLTWDRGSTVVKVLCYKSEGRWFDPSWCQWIFY